MAMISNGTDLVDDTDYSVIDFEDSSSMISVYVLIYPGHLGFSKSGSFKVSLI